MPRYAMQSVNIGGNSTTKKYEGEYRKGPYSNTYGSSGSNSGNGSSYRGSGGGGASVQSAAYGSYLDNWYAQQQAAANAAAAAKQAAAQAAYDRSMGALNNAYNTMRGNLTSNYNSTLGTLEDSYNSGVRGTNQQADRTMNEAYINYMLTRRDLPQLLAAQGINGGAAESTYASLNNNYGTSRNNIDRDRNDTLGNLLDQWNANKASALQQYNASLSELEAQKMAYQMQLEQALAQGVESAANARFDAMSNINSQYAQQALQLAEQQAAQSRSAAARTYTASNAYTTADTQQGASGGGGGLSAYAQQARDWYAQGATDNQVAQQLMASGLTNDQISQIMASIY